MLNLSGDMKHAFPCKWRSGGIELGSTAASHVKSHLLSFCAGIGGLEKKCQQLCNNWHYVDIGEMN